MVDGVEANEGVDCNQSEDQKGNDRAAPKTRRASAVSKRPTLMIARVRSKSKIATRLSSAAPLELVLALLRLSSGLWWIPALAEEPACATPAGPSSLALASASVGPPVQLCCVAFDEISTSAWFGCVAFDEVSMGT